MRYETVPISLGAAITADHADVPGSATGPAFVPIPRGAVSCEVKAKKDSGGAVTIPIAIYGSDRDPAFSTDTDPIASNANIDAEPNDTWKIEINDLDTWWGLAPYTNGSAGVFSAHVTAYFLVAKE